MSLDQVLLSSEQKFQRRIEVVRVAKAQGPQQALIKFGIPLRTIGSWVRRFNASGIEGLRDRSRAPHFVANKKDQDGSLATALKHLHEAEPGLNRMQIFAKLLLEPSPDTPTLSWINRTTRRLGLSYQPKKAKNQHVLRYEIPVPGSLQIDTKVIEKAGEPGEKLYQFTAIDECSRVRFLGSSLTKRARAAALFLEEAIVFFNSLGVSVIQAQTDNGTEFTLPHNELTLASYARGDTAEALFTQTCHQQGIRHKLIKPRTPQLNGKVERSHRIDNERFYSRFSFSSEYDHDHALKTVWMPEYNELRPHGALGGKTPIDFLRERLVQIKAKQQNGLLNQTGQTTDVQKAA
jgi:transposase InsO family protein